MSSPTPLTTEFTPARLCKAIAAYQPGIELHIEKADAMATSRESDDHCGFVYCVRHTPSWSRNHEVYEYVGETALTLKARFDMHYNTAFSRKSQKLGLTVGGLHHAMMLEYTANHQDYSSYFTIEAIRTTVGPQARKDAEAEEVARLKERSSRHYNLADRGGNRPPHLRYGQPIALVIGEETFHYPSKTSLWAALDDANCPALTKSLSNGTTATTKARSRWLLAEAEAEGSLAQMLGLESLLPVVRIKAQATKGRGPAPNHVWQPFHPGSSQTPRGNLRDALETRAKTAGISDKLLTTRTLYVRYSAGIGTLEEAWKHLLEKPLNPREIEIALPGMAPESRTLAEWGSFIEQQYSGQKVRALTAKKIQINLRNALKRPETLTSDRKLYALGLQLLPPKLRTEREVFNVKGPTPKHYVAVEFMNPLTSVTEHFESTAAMCKKYKSDPVYYYNRLKSGWRQAEALNVVKRKPNLRCRKSYRAAYATWLAQWSDTERQALQKGGYL
jgi:hypothetical protein